MGVNDYIVETLAPADFDEWVAHCGSIFEAGPAYFRRHFTADPHRAFESIFVIKADGQIVSTVRVFQREVYIDGKKFKMGGIGEVCTNTEYRKLGLSTKILAAAMDYMRENGFVISVLGAGYFKHYAKHGYVQIKAYKKTVSSETVMGSSCDLRPLNADNYRDMCALYEQYSRERTLSVVRSPEYFKLWCSVEMANPTGLFASGRLVGYICHEGNNVTELIAAPSDCELLLTAVKPEENRITLPQFAQTRRGVLGTHFENYIMVNLLSPIEAFGQVFTTTEAFCSYVNDNGGICHWNCDGF